MTDVEYYRNHGWDTDLRSEEDKYFVQPEIDGDRYGDEHLETPQGNDAHEDTEADRDRLCPVGFYRIEKLVTQDLSEVFFLIPRKKSRGLI